MDPKHDPVMLQPVRFVGIRHRVKTTADGEAKPTQVCVMEPGKDPRFLNLADEDQELKFVLGGRDGLRTGDTVAMILGGSGDYLAHALSSRAREIGARVIRMPAFLLKQERGEDKERDAEHLARLAAAKPELFYEVEPRDLALMQVRMKFRTRIDAMKARIACEQRLRSQSIGVVFCASSGLNPERDMTQSYAEIKANDPIYQAVLKEERRRERELVRALEELDVYNQIFAPIEGCGALTAARIISEVQDIRMYASPAKLKAKLGAHVLAGGKYADVPADKCFPRKRRGMTANWSNEGRKALFLLLDQFNRRPDSVWGIRFRENKVRMRERHPEIEMVGSKKRYTPAHIHKMAGWRTASQFVVRLWKDWTLLAAGQAAPQALTGTEG